MNCYRVSGGDAKLAASQEQNDGRGEFHTLYSATANTAKIYSMEDNSRAVAINSISVLEIGARGLDAPQPISVGDK